MKKTFLVMAGVMIIISASGLAANEPADDQQNARDAVALTLDRFHKAFGNRDTATLGTILTEPGIYCGSDPNEITWNKNFLLGYLVSSYFADTATVYRIDARKILMADDGKSAVAVEEFYYAPRSKYLPTRCDTHLIKKGDKWMIDFLSLSLTVLQTKIDKVNKALQQ